MNVPKDVLPSLRIIKKYTNRQIFLRLLLEMESLYANEKELPDYFLDSDWEKYIHLTGIIERFCFLLQLYKSRKNLHERRSVDEVVSFNNQNLS